MKESVLFGICSCVCHTIFPWIICGSLAVILLIIAINDFLFFRIEDEAIWSILGLYALSLACGVSGHNFLSGFIIAVAVFIITFILNQFEIIGGGDVKLLFPLLLFAEDSLDAFIIGISVGGAILILFYILFSKKIQLIRTKTIKKLLSIRRKHRKNLFLNVVLLSLSRIDNRTAALNYRAESIWRQEIPYGIVLSCGGFCVIFEILHM